MLKIGQILEFDVVFPKEKPLAVDQYLIGGSRSVILKLATFFLGFKNSNSKFSSNREFCSMFFRSENYEFANEVYSKIKKIEEKGAEVTIINIYSSLKLFEYFFSQPEEAQTQSEAEFEINLFKAYTVLNSEYTKKQNTAYSSVKSIDDKLILPMMTFCINYPIADKSNYEINQIWITQMVKSIYFFQFLESNKKMETLFKAFLDYFKSDSWESYLKILVPLTLPSIKQKTETYTDIVVEKDENFIYSCTFIEKLMISDIDELDQDDFLPIRSKPFYKVDDGVYRIIFDLFVVEKIFKGAYFILRDINEALPDEDKVSNLRSRYGKEFSEEILSYKVIESIYPDKCIRFSGKELEKMNIKGSPDYYIRKGKNILVFESKDFLIAADKKCSFDFNIYEAEFQRVLYYETMLDGKEKRKAVLQLIGNIRKLLKKEFPADTDYRYKDIFIYPILLTHDNQYNTPGFNELIDYWFQDELLSLKDEKLFIHRVKPLSVVNIDSLIHNQVGLSKDIQLHELLKLYHENKQMPQNQKFKSQEEYMQMKITKLQPFSMFIDNYFNKYKLWKLPPILDMVAPALFKDEIDSKADKR
jgi:hypothetical protein